MKRTQVRNQDYIKPEVNIIPIRFDSPLLNTSFPNGGHKKVGDDGQDLNAKQGFFDEDFTTEEPEHKELNLWNE